MRESKFEERTRCYCVAVSVAVAGVAVAAGSAAVSYENGQKQAAGQKAILDAESKKPKIVPYTPEDPSVAYNEYNTQVANEYPTLEKEAEGFNTVDNTNYQNLLARTSPGLLSGIKAQGQDASSLLKGEVPADVASQVQRSSAYTSLSNGYGAGSGAGLALSARSLGTTSLGLEAQGSTMLGANIADTKAVNPYDFTGDSLMLTPQQFLSRDDSNNAYANAVQNQNLNIQYQNGIYATAANSYNPTMAGMASGVGAAGGLVNATGRLATTFNGSGGGTGSYTTPGSDSYDVASSLATTNGVYNPYMDTNNYAEDGTYLPTGVNYGGG